MNTKNLYLSFTVFSSSFSAIADSSPEMIPSTTSGKETFSGFYGMGSVGHSRLSALRKGNLSNTGVNIGIQSNGSFVSGRPIFSAGFGYQAFVTPSILIGIEGLGFCDSHDKPSDTGLNFGGAVLSVSETLKKKYGAEVRARAGYLLRDDLCLSIGVGVEKSVFSYHYTVTGNDFAYPERKPKTLWGGFPFLGVRASVTETLSLDFTYKCTFYQPISVHWVRGNYQFNRSIKPSSSVAQLGLTYKIN